MTSIQEPKTITEQLVAAISAGWAAIQRNHPEVPDVVLTIGSGTMGVKPGKQRLGHFAAGRWQRGDDTLAEMFVSGEGLRRGAADVFTTELHEAAHSLAFVRGIKDTARRGQYHNKKYKTLAEELGLVIEHDQTIGFSITTLPPSTAAKYRKEIDQLTEAITAYRHDEVPGVSKPKAPNYIKATCECPRVIRVGKTVLGEAPILCGACGKEFCTEEAGDEDQD